MSAHDNLTAQVSGSHVLKTDGPRKMAKAVLPEIRKTDLDDWKEQIGGAIRKVRGALSLKEFADLVDRDDRTIARWEEGKERPQFDAIFAVRELRGPLVIALAELSQTVEVETTIRIRRSA
jgi:DNA-binding transcriptional regulator YiaG